MGQVVREFGSPDFDRLTALKNSAGKKSVDLLAELTLAICPHLPVPSEGNYAVMRPLISQFFQVQEHLFQGSSLLP